jgi:hypothetical protein
MVQGVFKGTTINSHEPGAHWQTCSMGEVHSEDDIIQKLRLKLLAPFLGGVPRVVAGALLRIAVHRAEVLQSTSRCMTTNSISHIQILITL